MLPRIGRRINWQVVSLLGGLAVAICSGALAGAFERYESSNAARATADTASIPASLQESDHEGLELVYVVTGSQAEATVLKSLLNAYAAAMPELARQLGLTHVVALESPGAEADFQSVLGLVAQELMPECRVLLVDARERTSSATGR